MAKIVIYDATELDKKQISAGLHGTDHNWVYVEHKISEENIDPDAEVIAVFVTSQVTQKMLEAMPRLKLIACRSTGYNNVDVAAANERGVTVVNVPTYGDSTVAEYAFTLLLALARKLPKALDSGADGLQAELTGWDLHGRTIGVVGTGHIGQKSIHIAKGFGMNVIAYDPFPNDSLASELGFAYVGFDELMATSDVVTLHAPLTPQTVHLVNADALNKMRPSAVIVNTARGELIDTKELIRALDEGKLAGAALDVIEGEVLLKQSEELALLRSNQISSNDLLHSMEVMTLSKMPNVIVTPHNAFNTVEAIERINSTTADNIKNFWYGEVPNAVKPMPKTMGKLMLVRHAESEWNALSKWTGTRDIHLSDKGFHDASSMAMAIKEMGFVIDVAFCSQQIRSLETLEAILNVTGQIDVPITRTPAMNERDYGDYTGKNKWEIAKVVGEEKFEAIRRGWDEPIPNGESLRKVYERVEPFYLNSILPLLKEGKNIIIAAHGNSLRALTKYIEEIPSEEIANLEMLFGEVVEYQVDEEGHDITKTVKTIEIGKTNA